MESTYDDQQRRRSHSYAGPVSPARTRPAPAGPPFGRSSTVARAPVFDDDRLQLTWPATGWQSLAGRLDSGNQAAALAMINEAAGRGRRNVDLSALREIDVGSLRAMLTSVSGAHLRRPSAEVRQMMDRLAAEEWTDIGARNGTAIAGFTVPTVVTALIWRTFGLSANRARTMLDWTGLLDQQAGPIGDLAQRYETSTATLRNRVRQASSRGAALPLTPRVLYDATRPTQPTDDALGRQRCAHILGIPGPVGSTAANTRAESAARRP